MLIEQDLKSMKTQVDMGCNFYVQAEVEDTNTLIVDIGKGIFVELNRQQTLSICDQKHTIFEKQVKAIKDKMAQIKANRRFVS